MLTPKNSMDRVLAGYSLVEVMVSMIILSLVTIGLYATLVLQSQAGKQISNPDPVINWSDMIDSVTAFPKPGENKVTDGKYVFKTEITDSAGGFVVRVYQVAPSSTYLTPGFPPLRVWVPGKNSVDPVTEPLVSTK